MEASELVEDVLFNVWLLQSDIGASLESRAISTAWRDAFPSFMKRTKGEARPRLTSRIKWLLGISNTAVLTEYDYSSAGLKHLFDIVDRLLLANIPHNPYLPFWNNKKTVLYLIRKKIPMAYLELDSFCNQCPDLELTLQLIPLSRPGDRLEAANCFAHDLSSYVTFMTEVLKQDPQLTKDQKWKHIRKIIKYIGRYEDHGDYTSAQEATECLDWTLGHLGITAPEVEDFIWSPYYYESVFDDSDEINFHHYPRSVYGVLFKYLSKTVRTFFRIANFPSSRRYHQDQVEVLLGIVPHLPEDKLVDCYVETAKQDLVEVARAFKGMDPTKLYYAALKQEALEILNWLLETIDLNPEAILVGINYSCREAWQGKGTLRLIQELPKLKIDWKRANELIPKFRDIVFFPIYNREDIITNTLIFLGEMRGSHLDDVASEIDINWQRLFRRLCRRGSPMRLIEWLLHVHPKELGDLKVGMKIAQENGHKELARNFGRIGIFWL